MNEAPRAAGTFKRTLLRVLVSAALLALLAWKVPLRDVGGALARVPPAGLALALVVLAIQNLVGAARWWRMLVRTGERPRFAALVGDGLVGAAYNLVLPSAVGGDVVRAHRAGRRLGAPAHAWSTALFERMVGLPTLAAIAAPGIAIVPGGEALVLPTLVVAFVGVVAIAVIDAPLRWAARRLLARAPGAAGVADGVARDFAGPLATAGARAEALAWSLVYQLLSVSILAACVLPTGDARLLSAIYAGVPLVVIGTMAPITAGGFGLRESLFVVVLGRLGVDRGTALALALLWLASSVVLALVGLVVAWLSPGDERAPPSVT